MTLFGGKINPTMGSRVPLSALSQTWKETQGDELDGDVLAALAVRFGNVFSTCAIEVEAIKSASKLSMNEKSKLIRSVWQSKFDGRSLAKTISLLSEIRIDELIAYLIEREMACDIIELQLGRQDGSNIIEPMNLHRSASSDMLSSILIKIGISSLTTTLYDVLRSSSLCHARLPAHAPYGNCTVNMILEYCVNRVQVVGELKSFAHMQAFQEKQLSHTDNDDFNSFDNASSSPPPPPLLMLSNPLLHRLYLPQYLHIMH